MRAAALLARNSAASVTASPTRGWLRTMVPPATRLPPTGALLFVQPLRLVGGTGSPARVLALVESA